MIWSKCLKRLQSEVSAQEIDIWLRPLKVIEELNSINIIAPNDIIMDRINDNYLKLLKLALNDISDIDYEITVSYPISPFTQNNHNQKNRMVFHRFRQTLIRLLLLTISWRAVQTVWQWRQRFVSRKMLPLIITLY